MAEHTELIQPTYTLLANDKDTAEGGCPMRVFAPASTTGRVPLVIMIHGGGFIVGGAEDIPYNQVRYLTDARIAVVSPTYRLLPHATFTDMRFDIMDAYRFIQDGKLNDHIKQNGGDWEVDPTNIIALGWSAGGFLALFLGIDIGTSKDLQPLKAVVATYPLTDLSEVSVTYADLSKYRDENPGFAEALKTLNAEKPVSDYGMTSLLSPPPGTGEGAPSDPRAAPPAPPPRFIVLGPLLDHGFYQIMCAGQNGGLIPESAQPLYSVTQSSPPTFIVVAGADTRMPKSNSYKLRDKLKELGVENHLVQAKGIEHGLAECLPQFGPWPQGCGWWEDAILPSLEFVKGKLGV